MEISELENKLVAVLGFGQEGQATVSYLIKHGIKPVLFDERSWEDRTEIEQSEIKKLGINFVFGPEAFLELKGFDVAFRSPGISLNNLSLALPSIGEGKLQITSQTKWFFDHCPAKIIGVTGTKGKGTTASLIFEMLMRNFQFSISNFQTNPNVEMPNPKAYLTGNIGKTQPFEILDNLKADDWVVYELSSFQLQDLQQSPHIGVVLMTTSEHLDYHKDENEYVEAKSAIVKYQSAKDTAVINNDFPNSLKIGALGLGKKIFFSRKAIGKDCFVDQGHIVVKNSDFIFDLAELGIIGEHNYENACAAVLAARSAGCDDNSIKTVLREFAGLEHRLEFVVEKNGIKFYNDSFSTTPETAIAAIKAFTVPEILILGGSSKNSDFAELAETVSQVRNLKTIILIGEESKRIKDLIKEKFTGKLLEGAQNFEQVFEQIKSCAQSGDTVVLSPACASFDWFENYKQRGLKFKELANKF
ncbi:MAG: UDP-N-acetylmuramoyl-L-alanine--D-glutamate ligase [Candidatus Doudnabacteria bacterium]|jgi:UDP-N-acetylmuramoylalanine--D-glutamate ligase